MHCPVVVGDLPCPLPPSLSSAHAQAVAEVLETTVVGSPQAKAGVAPPVESLEPRALTKASVMEAMEVVTTVEAPAAESLESGARVSPAESLEPGALVSPVESLQSDLLARELAHSLHGRPFALDVRCGSKRALCATGPEWSQ